MQNNEKIICNNIWKLFGPNEKSILSNLDKSLSRNEVQEKTGHVIAVKDVSFSIKKGETPLGYCVKLLLKVCDAKGIDFSALSNNCSDFLYIFLNAYKYMVL